MEFLNVDSYMESVFKNCTKSILSYSKNNEPRIDFKQRIYGVKGKKNPLVSFRIFKCSLTEHSSDRYIN